MCSVASSSPKSSSNWKSSSMASISASTWPAPVSGNSSAASAAGCSATTSTGNSSAASFSAVCSVTSCADTSAGAIASSRGAHIVISIAESSSSSSSGSSAGAAASSTGAASTGAASTDAASLGAAAFSASVAASAAGAVSKRPELRSPTRALRPCVRLGSMLKLCIVFFAGEPCCLTRSSSSKGAPAKVFMPLSVSTMSRSMMLMSVKSIVMLLSVSSSKKSLSMSNAGLAGTLARELRLCILRGK
mmetsp:Transcript_7432/g.31499  ORF Transcript_7432/g.31499 Transcript_7432/m.31499 type:complete len:247 (-) Transcript_7432:347-1087(-)